MLPRHQQHELRRPRLTSSNSISSTCPLLGLEEQLQAAAAGVAGGLGHRRANDGCLEDSLASQGGGHLHPPNSNSSSSSSSSKMKKESFDRVAPNKVHPMPRADVSALAPVTMPPSVKSAQPTETPDRQQQLPAAAFTAAWMSVGKQRQTATPMCSCWSSSNIIGSSSSGSSRSSTSE
ncbi:hypothetical protein ACSSS7_004320 [Eimeria intestinalis]